MREGPARAGVKRPHELAATPPPLRYDRRASREQSSAVERLAGLGVVWELGRARNGGRVAVTVLGGEAAHAATLQGARSCV